MGALPGTTIQLVERTPYRLRYLLTSTGEIGDTVLPNAADTTPDLRTDALAAAQHGFFGIPILQAMSVPLNTAGGTPAPQVQARSLLLEGPIEAKIIPRQGAAGAGPGSGWVVDADEGAAAGDPASAGFFVYVISAGIVAAETAYLDIKLRRTKDDGGIAVKP